MFLIYFFALCIFCVSTSKSAAPPAIHVVKAADFHGLLSSFFVCVGVGVGLGFGVVLGAGLSRASSNACIIIAMLSSLVLPEYGDGVGVGIGTLLVSRTGGLHLEHAM